jgi:hypothetical protein
VTRKHYVAMADELRSVRGVVMALASQKPGFMGINTTRGAQSLDTILHDYERAIARVFAADNPAFRHDRFMSRLGR